jgi:hypothetical protein
LSNAHGVCDACDCRTSPGDEIAWTPSTRVVRHLYCDPRGDYLDQHRFLRQQEADRHRAMSIESSIKVINSMTDDERRKWFPHRYRGSEQTEQPRLRVVK